MAGRSRLVPVTAKLKKLMPLWMHQNVGEEVIKFVRTVTVAKNQAAAGVTVLAASEVPAGFVPYVQDWQVDVSGATAWTDGTATKVGLYDTNGSPVTFFEIAKAGLTGNATLGNHSANTTLGAGYRGYAGGTSGAGLIFKGDADFANGSDLKVTVIGYYKKAS